MTANYNTESAHRSRNLTAMPPYSSQRGSTLIVSLIMLLLISLIGISSMEGTIMQERMASNLQDRNIAFQASESALRVGENWLEDHQVSASDNDRLADTSVWGTSNSSSNATPVDISDDQVSSNPAYHIGYVGCSPQGGVELSTFRCLDRFAVTARGSGGSDNTKVVLQTVFMPKPR